MTISVNNMVTLAHLESSQGYYIHISMCVTTRNIHIFKYDSQRCEYDVFAVDQQETACEYINRSLPRGGYQINID